MSVVPQKDLYCNLSDPTSLSIVIATSCSLDTSWLSKATRISSGNDSYTSCGSRPPGAVAIRFSWKYPHQRCQVQNHTRDGDPPQNSINLLRWKHPLKNSAPTYFRLNVHVECVAPVKGRVQLRMFMFFFFPASQWPLLSSNSNISLKWKPKWRFRRGQEHPQALLR